jgi:hypothetical protein
MLIVLAAADGHVTAYELTWWLRALTTLWSARLDQQLAKGASPDGSAMLAVRADRLVRPAVRQALARRLVAVLTEASAPALWPRGCRIPVQGASVRAAAGSLAVLVDRLLTPAPLPARGIAQVQLLLTDGSGPLYYSSGGEQLRTVVLQAVDALEPVPDW